MQNNPVRLSLHLTTAHKFPAPLRTVSHWQFLFHRKNLVRNVIVFGEIFASLNRYSPSVIHRPDQIVSIRPVSNSVLAQARSPASSSASTRTAYFVNGCNLLPSYGTAIWQSVSFFQRQQKLFHLFRCFGSESPISASIPVSCCFLLLASFSLQLFHLTVDILHKRMFCPAVSFH